MCHADTVRRGGCGAPEPSPRLGCRQLQPSPEPAATIVISVGRVQLRLLGPVEIVDATGRAVPVGGPKERALLALLGIHANEAVSEDRIVDALWGDDPPRTAS